MAKYLIVETATGRIDRIGSCYDAELAYQANEGETLIQLTADQEHLRDDLHYYKEGEWRSYPPQPSSAHIFNYETETYEEPVSYEALAIAKSNAIYHLNHYTQKLREKHITSIAGQELVYNAKEAEAREFLASGEEEANSFDFPFLAAEVGVTAQSAYELAQLWLNLAAQLRAFAAQTESFRLSTSQAIMSATSLLEVEAILATLNGAI